MSVTDGYAAAPARMGFFTDTSVCIGCKACERVKRRATGSGGGNDRQP
jgi:Fe-S-cluster-containing dehydrogenase component